MKRCVRKAVHAAMTKATLTVMNKVSRDRWCRNTILSPFLCFCRSSKLVAEVQYMGPAQLLTSVRKPTATTLKPLMPLYALERSTEEMALEPPKAKKDVYWSRMEMVLISMTESSTDSRVDRIMLKTRNRGILTALDWVMARSV